MTPAQSQSRALALLLPFLLLAGAWGSQLVGGLAPCEMCHWQRWPHYAALVVAGLAFVVPGRSSKVRLVALAAVLIALSGAIGVYHAGVEYHWWHGATACSSGLSGAGLSTEEVLAKILAQPVVRCDAPQWTLFGISLAGFNAIFSLGGAALILWLLRERRT